MNVGSVNSLEAARRYLSELAIAQNRMEPWRPLRRFEHYHPTPSSSTSFRVPDDELSIWRPGLPLRWNAAGNTYYGAISNITLGNGLVGIFGPAMSADIDAMWIGQPDRTVTKELSIVGEYGGLTGDIGYSLGYSRRWMGPPAYLVGASVRHTIGKTGGTTEPTVNLYRYDGSYHTVGASNLVVSTTEQYFYTVLASAYGIMARETFGVEGISADDGSPHAKNLNATLVFVLE